MRYYQYRNNRNGNKYIEVIRYSCGHYAFKQFIKTNNHGRTYTGTTIKRANIGTWHRITRKFLCEILEDYKIMYSCEY